jgi:hypothetical protein
MMNLGQGNVKFTFEELRITKDKAKDIAGIYCLLANSTMDKAKDN